MTVEQTLNFQDGIVGDILITILKIDPFTFVVGGAVRDNFLGKTRNNDLDLVMAMKGCEVAERIVSIFSDGITHVPLDKDTGTSRIVVWKDAFFSIDVCTFQGADIHEDLARRDFTINAMAVPLRDFLDSRFVDVIDPTGGLSDLSQAIIRACSTRCFIDDPLRILRAYRFAALLGFDISAETRALMKESIPKLSAVSAERLREELFFILCEENSSHTVDMIQADGVLDALFPEIIPSRGFEQNDYHHLDVFNHALETLRCLETVFTNLPAALDPFGDRIEEYLNREVVKGRPRRALLKLGALFHDLGKPSSLTIDPSGRRRFSGHEVASEHLVKQIASRLRLSRKEQKILCQWVRGHMRGTLLSMLPLPQKGTKRLCREFGDDIIGLLLLIISDRAATRGPRAKKSEGHAIELGAGQVLESYFQRIEAPVQLFVDGHDLINFFGMSQGPEIGRILRVVRELQEDGILRNREEALAKVHTLLHR